MYPEWYPTWMASHFSQNALLSKGLAGSNGPCHTLQNFETCPEWGVTLHSFRCVSLNWLTATCNGGTERDRIHNRSPY